MTKVWKVLLAFPPVIITLVFLLLIVINNIDLNQYKHYIEEKVTAYTGRRLKIDGGIQLHLSSTPYISVENLSFANAEWGQHDEMLTVEYFQMKIQLQAVLDGELVVDYLKASGVRLIVEKNNAGEFNWVLTDEVSADEYAESNNVDLTLLPVLKQVEINDVIIEYVDNYSSIETDVKIQMLSLSNHEINQPFSINVNGDINGYPFDVVGKTLIQPSDMPNELAKSLLLTLNANYLNFNLDIKGGIRQPILDGGIDVNLVVKTNDISKAYKSFTGKELDKTIFTDKSESPLNFKTRITNKNDSYNFEDVVLKVSNSELTGNVFLQTINDRVNVTVEADAEKIILYPRGFGGDKKKISARKLSNGTLYIPENEMNFDWLRRVDMEVLFSADKLIVNGVRFKSLVFDADLNDAVLNVKQLDVNFNGGAFRGNGEANVSVEPEFKVQALFNDIKLQPWFSSHKEWFLDNSQLNGSVDVSAKGKNAKDIFYSMVGESIFKIENLSVEEEIDGLLQKINIDLLELNFSEMSEALKYSVRGSVNAHNYSVKGSIDSIKSVLNNKKTWMKLAGDFVGASFDVDILNSSSVTMYPADVQLSLYANDLSKTHKALSHIFPSVRIKEVFPALKSSVKANINVQRKHYKMNNLKFVVGESDVQGDVSLDLTKEKINVVGDLKSIFLDVNALYPAMNGTPLEAEKSSNKKAGEVAKVFSTTDLPELDFLEMFNAQVNYDVSHMRINAQEIKRISLKAKVRGGVLSFLPLSMRFSGGEFIARLTLSEADGWLMHVDGDADNIRFEQLMTLVGVDEYAKGVMDAHIKLIGSGDTLGRLMASLDGRFRLESQSGSLNMGALNLLSKDFGSLIPFTDKGDRQKIRCAVIDFDIEDGLANVNALVLDTGMVSALGAGEINLALETLSLYIAPRTRQTSVLKLALVPFNVEGSLSSPSITPDLVGTTLSTTNKALHIGLAVATGGITLLTEDLTDQLWTRYVDDTDFCALALSGKKVVPTVTKLKGASEEIAEDAEQGFDYIEELEED